MVVIKFERTQKIPYPFSINKEAKTAKICGNHKKSTVIGSNRLYIPLWKLHSFTHYNLQETLEVIEDQALASADPKKLLPNNLEKSGSKKTEEENINVEPQEKWSPQDLRYNDVQLSLPC